MSLTIAIIILLKLQSHQIWYTLYMRCVGVRVCVGYANVNNTLRAWTHHHTSDFLDLYYTHT